MKYFLLLLAIAALTVTGCKSDDNTNNGPNNGPNYNNANGVNGGQSRAMPNQ